MDGIRQKEFPFPTNEKFKPFMQKNTVLTQAAGGFNKELEEKFAQYKDLPPRNIPGYTQLDRALMAAGWAVSRSAAPYHEACHPDSGVFSWEQKYVTKGSYQFESKQDDFKKLEDTLPPGYEFFWDGEYDSIKTSQLALLPGVLPAVLVMISILVYLFNGYRTPLVIILTLPFGMSGIVAGLLIFDMPFGFVALLGAMSLGGIMLRNSVVLLETIDHLLAEGKTRYEAIAEGALSRARPVTVAATTCGLGLIPLLGDVFWSSMAAAMLCGVMVGTVLTLVVAPVLYATLFGVHSPEDGFQ